MDAEKWIELEDEFANFGFSHIFSKSRFVILLRLEEFEWPPTEIVRMALQEYRKNNKEFTFQELIFKMYVLTAEKVQKDRRDETDRILQKYRKNKHIQDGG